MADIYAFLDANGITYQRHDHPPVYTVEEAQRLVPELPAAHTKNLFLRDEKGRRHFLVMVAHDKQVDLRRLSTVLGSSKLSFGSPDRLARHLGVEPGAVTILAVINDPERKVEVVIDRDLWKAEALRCHPLVNTATLVVRREGVQRVLQVTGHPIQLIDVPTRTAA
jgi:Ala-tRNA(Pro) deacylase